MEPPILEGFAAPAGTWRARCRLCPWVSEEETWESSVFVAYQAHYAREHLASSYPTDPTLAPQPPEGGEAGA